MLVLDRGRLTSYQSLFGIDVLGPGPLTVAISGGSGAACAQSVVGAIRCVDYYDSPMDGTPTDPVAEVDADYFAACAIDLDGEGQCWGGEGGFTVPAAPSGPLHGITVSAFHACALDADNRPVCWGDLDPFGVEYWWEDPPDAEFVRIDAGWGATCGLDAAGEITCWGHGTEGYPAWETVIKDAPPGPWVDLSFSGRIACAIDADGKVACWGDSDSELDEVPEDIAR